MSQVQGLPLVPASGEDRFSDTSSRPSPSLPRPHAEMLKAGTDEDVAAEAAKILLEASSTPPPGTLPPPTPQTLKLPGQDVLRGRQAGLAEGVTSSLRLEKGVPAAAREVASVPFRGSSRCQGRSDLPSCTSRPEVTPATRTAPAPTPLQTPFS